MCPDRYLGRRCPSFHAVHCQSRLFARNLASLWSVVRAAFTRMPEHRHGIHSMPKQLWRYTLPCACSAQVHRSPQLCRAAISRPTIRVIPVKLPSLKKFQLSPSLLMRGVGYLCDQHTFSHPRPAERTNRGIWIFSSARSAQYLEHNMVDILVYSTSVVRTSHVFYCKTHASFAEASCRLSVCPSTPQYGIQDQLHLKSAKAPPLLELLLPSASPFSFSFYPLPLCRPEWPE
jgi:hypothetical protein